MKATIVFCVLLFAMLGGSMAGNLRYDPDLNCVCWCRKPGICSSDHCFCGGERKGSTNADANDEPAPYIIVIPPFPTQAPTKTATMEPYPPVATVATVEPYP